MTHNRITRRRIRFTMLALLVVLAPSGPGHDGARARRTRSKPSLRPLPSVPRVSDPRARAENVHIYHQAAPAVANIVTQNASNTISSTTPFR